MKNYVLCTTIEDSCLDTLKRLKKDIELKHAVIHLINIVEIQVYNVEFAPYVYPTEAQYADIEKNALDKLKNLQHALGVEDKNIIMKCFFEHSREQKIKHYLNEVNADLVVTATRGKHGIQGFFSSSFTDFLTKFSPCDVLVMRPTK